MPIKSISLNKKKFNLELFELTFKEMFIYENYRKQKLLPKIKCSFYNSDFEIEI